MSPTRPHRWRAVAAVLGAGVILAGHVRPAPAGPRAAPLTVFAAASLTDAFRELGRQYEARHPGTTVRFNFAGSQQLAVQLEQGAEADVFASADARWMTYVRDRNLVAGAPRELARNRLVAIVPASNRARIDRLEALARPGVKLVVAAEAVPAGKYSREMLRNLSREPGFGADYADRVLRNVVSEEETVRSVAAKVQLGEADAGIVYRSDVSAKVAALVHVLDIPDRHNVTASYPIAVLARSADPSAARAFVAFATSAEGQALLERHGFLRAAHGARAVERAGQGTR